MNLKYGPHILEETKLHIDGCKDDKYPTIASLARHLKVSKMSIYKWRKKYKEFDELIDDLLCLQEDMLIEHGLSGQWNSNIVKLLLNNHGYGWKDEDNQGSSHRKVNLIFQGVDKEDPSESSEP